jgi:hypothetical protein
MQQHVTLPPRRGVIVGISGAAGEVNGLRLLEAPRERDIESHPVGLVPHAGLVRRWSGRPETSGAGEKEKSPWP